MDSEKPPDVTSGYRIPRPISLPPPDHISPFHGASTIMTPFGTVPSTAGDQMHPLGSGSLSPAEYSDIPSFPHAYPATSSDENHTYESSSNSQFIPLQPSPRPLTAIRSSSGVTTSSGAWSRPSTQRSVVNVDYPTSTSSVNASEEKRVLAWRSSSQTPSTPTPPPNTLNIPGPSTSLPRAGGSKPLPAPPSAFSPVSPPIPRQLRRDQSIGAAQVIQEEDAGAYHDDSLDLHRSVAIPPAYTRVPSDGLRSTGEGSDMELL